MIRRREAPETRRREILHAAVQVMCERGWYNTRITDVAERAGASPALVVHYFETRDRLLAEALAFSEERFYQAVGELQSVGAGREQIVWLLVAVLDLDSEVGQREAATLWLDLWAQARHDPGLGARRRELDRKWRETIATIVRRGQAAGDLDPVDPDDFAVRLAAMLDGFAIQMVLDDPDVSAERMFDLCIEMCARELGFTWSAPDRARILEPRRARRSAPVGPA